MKNLYLRISRWSIPLAATVLLAIGYAAPAASQALPQAVGDLGAAVSGDLLYVCNQDEASVAVIDIESGTIVRTVDLQERGFSENARPHHIAVEPDGSHWYVSLIGDGVVVKLNRDDEVVETARFETPGMLGLDAERGLLWVGRSMTAVNPPPRIGMIRTEDMFIDEVDIFFPQPHAMILHPETGIVYTASLSVNQVAAVDPETERAEITNVDGPPHALMQFAVSPDGQTLAISGEISHTLHFFDISEDPLRPRHTGYVEVETQPFDPIFTRDGSTVWLPNKAADKITAVDVETREIVTVLDDDRIRQPHGAAVSQDGRWVLISSTNVREPHMMMMHGDDHQDHHDHDDHAPAERIVGGPGNVVIIDARTGEIAHVVEVGRNATGIAPTR